MTPSDDYAFIGDPPMIRPEATEVHVSCTFTWDIPEAQRLALAWLQYYPVVRLGGPAVGSPANGFTPGLYVKQGMLFTSRGCNNRCPWCLVPDREGKLRELSVQQGHNILDNNVLQCSKPHLDAVFAMLRKQHGIRFSGGLDSRYLTEDIADQLRSLRIKFLFFACDTADALKSLERASALLRGLSREKLRCFVMIGYNGESLPQAEERLKAVWQIGFMPFAQLYQPPDQHIDYSREWRTLARVWARPALMKRAV